MVKFLKSIVAIFLSCAMLFCNVSECFGVGDDSKPNVEMKNFAQPDDDSAVIGHRHLAGRSSQPPDPRNNFPLPSTLVPVQAEQISEYLEGSTTGPTYPSKPYGKDEVIILLPEGDEEEATRAYASRRVHAADGGRSIKNDDHSKVTVSTQDFFLYPPKSVKELFELKDRIDAFAYKESVMHTDIARSIGDRDCCCRGCNCPKCCGVCCSCPESWNLWTKGIFHYIVLFFSLFSAAIAAVQWVEEAGGRTGIFDDDCSSSITIGDFFKETGDWICFFVVIGSLVIAGISLKNACRFASKTCCDCYLCKPSDDGCSYCYGCHKFPQGCDCFGDSNGNGYVCCVNCCNCREDNCCLSNCPCDNGGFGCDWCGRYGVGSCCGKIYQDFLSGEIKSVAYFEKFLRGLHYGFESDMLDPHNSAITYFRDILRSPSLTFQKLCGAHSMKPGKMIGLNQADGCLMIPARAYTILGGFGSDKFPPPAGVQDYNVWTDFAGDCSSAAQDPFGFLNLPVDEQGKIIPLDLEGFINHLYEKMYDRDVDTVLPEFQFRVLSDKDLVGKFIFVTLALCRYALGNTGELDDFARVRLRNYFNFLLALWNVRGFERK